VATSNRDAEKIKELEAQLELQASITRDLFDLIEYAPKGQQDYYRDRVKLATGDLGELASAMLSVVGEAAIVRENWVGVVSPSVRNLFDTLDNYIEVQAETMDPIVDATPPPVLKLVQEGD